MPDYALIWDPATGSSDMSLFDDDLESDGGLRTAVMLSIFTDRRANDDDVLPNTDGDKRGWFGDQFSENIGDKFGSRRWLLARTKITQGLITAIESYDREALQWLVEDKVAERVELAYEIVSGKLYSSISIHRPNGDASNFKFENIWTAEESGPIVVDPDETEEEEEEDEDMAYMDTIEVVSTVTGPGQVVGPLTRISFGAVGDGKLSASLDSETDGRYFIDCYWVRPAGVGTAWLRIEPDGSPATPAESLETITWESTIGSPSGALEQAFSIAVHSEQSEHDFEVSFDPKIVAGRSQRIMYSAGTVIRDQNDWIFKFDVSSRWDNVVSTFTSLDLVSSISNMIGIGSVFHLYRRPRS